MLDFPLLNCSGYGKKTRKVAVNILGRIWQTGWFSKLHNLTYETILYICTVQLAWQLLVQTPSVAFFLMIITISSFAQKSVQMYARSVSVWNWESWFTISYSRGQPHVSIHLLFFFTLCHGLGYDMILTPPSRWLGYHTRSPNAHTFTIAWLHSILWRFWQAKIVRHLGCGCVSSACADCLIASVTQVLATG